MPRGVYKAEKLFRMKQRQYEREGTGDSGLTPTELAAYATVKQTGGTDAEAAKAANIKVGKVTYTPDFLTNSGIDEYLSTVSRDKVAELNQAYWKSSGKDFWNTKDFDNYATGLIRAEVEFQKATPIATQPKINTEGLKSGQRLYYDPEKNVITGTTAFVVSGGQADRPTSTSQSSLLPLYLDKNGNLTFDKTDKAAIYTRPESEVIAERQRNVQQKSFQEAITGYDSISKVDEKLKRPSWMPEKPEGAQDLVELSLLGMFPSLGGIKKELNIEHLFTRNANEPLVSVGYTSDGQPFSWGSEASKIKETRDYISSLPLEDGWWAKAKRNLGLGALSAVEWAYPAILGLQEGALRVEEVIQSPVLQATVTGRAINGILVQGREFMAGLKSQWLSMRYDKVNRATEILINSPDIPEETKKEALQRRNELALEMNRQYQATREIGKMAEDIRNHLWDNTYLEQEGWRWKGKGDIPTVKAWGLTIKDEMKTLQEIFAESQDAKEKMQQSYDEAFNLVADGDLQSAEDKVKEAIAYDEAANPWANPYESYSFAQDPTEKEAFLNDVAILTLQKGSALTLEEIRRVRQIHENFWVEMVGQGILDPLNLPIANVIMDGVVDGAKTILRVVGGVADDALKSRAAEKILVGKFYQYLTRETVGTTSNKIYGTINNMFQQMLRNSGSTDEFTTALRDVLEPALRKADDNPQAMLQIFEEARKAPGGRVLDNISLEDFRQLVTSYSNVSGKNALKLVDKLEGKGTRLLEGDEWARYLDESFRNYPLERARHIAEKVSEYHFLDDAEKATLVQRIADARAATPRYAGESVSNFAHQMGRAFVDYHRISTGSNLIDDSLSGMFAQWLKGTFKGGFGSNSAKVVEYGLAMAKTVRDVWTNFVLSLRPAWVVQNVIDSTFRHWVYGGSVWDDMKTLLLSTQAHLADEIGIVPIEFAQSLSRAGLDFEDSVAARLLYSDWKPGIIQPLSYIGYEKARVGKIMRKSAEEALSDVPEGFGKSVRRLKNWFKIETISTVKGLSGGMADMNTAIEFTLRLRMFNREYFRLLRAIEPTFTGTLYSDVPEHLKPVANQIWRTAQSNPGKIKAYVDSLEGAYKGGRAYWSFNVPPEIQKSVAGMTAFDQENFITSVRVQVDNLVDEILKSGRKPEPEDFKKFFDDLIDKYQVETEARMAEAAKLRQLKTRIPTDKTTSDMPGIGYLQDVYKETGGPTNVFVTSTEREGLTRGRVSLKRPYLTEDEGIKKAIREGGDQLKEIQTKLNERGFDGIVVRNADGTDEVLPFYASKQFQTDVQLRGQVVSDAAKQLRQNPKKVGSQPFIENYSAAMKRFADVETVPGNTVNVFSSRGKVTIQVGEDVLNDKGGLKRRLLDATRDALYKTDEGYLRAKNLFANQLDYTSKLRNFSNDPLQFLLDNTEREFHTLAQQLHDYPEVRQTLEALYGKRIKFEGADTVWDRYIRTLDPWTEGPEVLRRTDRLVDDVHVSSVEFRLAGDTERESTSRLGKFIESGSLPEDTITKIQDFREAWGKNRERLREWYLKSYPGPRRVAPGAAVGERSRQFEIYDKLRTESYYAGANIKTRINDLLEAGDYESANALLDEWNNDFVQHFLDEHGITYEASSDGMTIYNVSVPNAGRTVKAQDQWSIDNFIAHFLAQDKTRVPTPVRVATNRDVMRGVYNNTYSAMYNIMGLDGKEADTVMNLMLNRAEEWSNLSGASVGDYFARFGLSELGVDEAKFSANIPGIADEIGRTLPFGLGHQGETAVEDMITDSAQYFLEDLRYAESFNKEAGRLYRVIKPFVGENGAVDYRGFAKKFLEFTETGKYSHKGYGKLFDEYKRFLSRMYEDVLDTSIEEQLDTGVNELLSKISNDVALYPKAEGKNRTLRIIADELGLSNKNEDVLKVINDDIKETTNAEWTEALKERASVSQTNFEEFEKSGGLKNIPGYIENRPLTTADSFADEGRIGKATAEYIGQRAANPEFNYPEEFSTLLAIHIDGLPESMRARLDEDLLKSLKGEKGGFEFFALSRDEVKDLKGAAWDGFSFGKVGTDDTPVMVFNSEDIPNLVERKSILPHEMVHMYYNELSSNPASRAIIDQHINSVRQETTTLLKKVTDEAWVKDIADTSADKIATRIRDNYQKLKRMSYVKYETDEIYPALEIKARLQVELSNIQRTITGLEDGSLNSLKELQQYLTLNRDYPMLALYMGQPNGQYLNYSLLNTIGKEYGFDLPPIIEEELMAYSLERFSVYSPSYDVVGQMFDALAGKPKLETFGNLDDATLVYGRDALHRQAQKAAGTAIPIPPAMIDEEMKAAWETWSTAKDFRAFGKESDRESVEAFRDYLRRQMLNPDISPNSELYATYRQLMWQTEQFQDAVLTFHRGDDLREALMPVIPQAEIGDEIKSWMRANEYSLKNMEAGERTLKDWKNFLVGKAEGKDPLITQRFTREEMDTMKAWAEKATKAKSDLVSTIINGGDVSGRNITGVVDEVNHVMLDYNTRNNLDQIMSNVFPFWMFPSRSWPFWTETLATHPNLISLYLKVKRASQSARYQAGAVTSKGEPLPSLEGYLPIQLPGMDEPAWVNPLAPISFRYVLDPMNMIDDLRYSLQDSNQDMPPLAYMTKTLLEGAPQFGFYMAPWMIWGLKVAANIPDYVLPQFPFLPQIGLIPRWQIPDQIRLAGKMIPTLKDWWYPEASWHDYLVEREILRDALQVVQDSGMTEAQKMQHARLIEKAIRYKDTPDSSDPESERAVQIWNEAVQKMDNTQAGKSWMAYFTGVFTKDFSDEDADLYALRNEMNLYKAALQNQVQAQIFFGDNVDRDYALYDKYIDNRNTSRGYLYQVYSDIGWIVNEAGMIERDPEKRAKLLAIKIDQRNRNNAYYDAIAAARSVLEEGLRSLPIGAPWQQSSKFYDDYYNTVSKANDKYDPTFEYYGSSKSSQRIADDLTSRWYSYLWDSRPRWNPLEYETYQDYEARVAEWEQNLPQLSSLLMRHFQSHDPYVTKIMGHLQDTQALPQGFWGTLMGATAADLEDWRRQNNDDVFDALNKAWQEMYWNPYWDAVEGYSGQERAYIEQKFNIERPAPTTQELYDWIQERYGDKFSYDEVKKWVEGSNSILNIDERLQYNSTPVEKVESDIWDIMSWIAPGGTVRDDFEERMIRKGMNRYFLSDWYDGVYSGNEEILNKMRELALQTVAEMDLAAPTSNLLAEWAIAQRLNDSFNEVKQEDFPVLFSETPGMNEYAYYQSLEYKEQKQYKKDYPEYYQMIQDYYDARDAYAQANPLWAKYYNPYEYEKGTEKSQIIPEGSPVTGGFSAIKWPAGMKNRLSPILVGNIENVYSSGATLSTYDLDYLKKLKESHPEWASFINEVIIQGK